MTIQKGKKANPRFLQKKGPSEETPVSSQGVADGVQKANHEVTDEMQAVIRWQDAILSSASCGIIATNTEGLILTFNPAAERMLGYRANEVVAELSLVDFHEPIEIAARAKLLSQELGKQIEPNLETIMAKSRLGLPDENDWTYVRKDGSRLPVSLSVTAWHDSLGAVRGFLGIVTDLTERKKAMELAIIANHAKSNFLANMSHEIRTPMNTIMGMGELLFETELDSKQRTYLELQSKASQGLLNIINDILDLSKLESEVLHLEVVDFNLKETIQEILQQITVRAELKGLRLTQVFDPGIPDRVQGDPNRLKQVLVNLLGNAIKFTKEGTIDFRMEPYTEAGVQDSVLISISDTGIGISKEQIENIFERFIQADTSITRSYGGNGLGLSISKRLIELMGGKIQLTSQLGVGSSFSFFLKYAKSNILQSQDRILKPAVLKSSRPLQILVVDDQESNQILITTFLKKTNYQLEIAENGMVGLQKFQTRKYDLVLMDIQMPILDGYSATREIRKWELSNHKSPTPIVAVTANALSHEKQASLDSGCNYHITKPFKKELLLSVIINMTEKTPNEKVNE